MNRTKRLPGNWKLIPGVLMIVFALIVLFGCVSMRGTTIEDAAGRFSSGRSYILEDFATDGSYYHYYPGDVDVHSFGDAESAPTEDQALARVFLKVGLDVE